MSNPKLAFYMQLKKALSENSKENSAFDLIYNLNQKKPKYKACSINNILEAEANEFIAFLEAYTVGDDLYKNQETNNGYAYATTHYIACKGDVRYQVLCENSFYFVDTIDKVLKTESKEGFISILKTAQTLAITPFYEFILKELENFKIQYYLMKTKTAPTGPTAQKKQSKKFREELKIAIALKKESYGYMNKIGKVKDEDEHEDDNVLKEALDFVDILETEHPNLYWTTNPDESDFEHEQENTRERLLTLAYEVAHNYSETSTIPELCQTCEFIVDEINEQLVDFDIEDQQDFARILKNAQTRAIEVFYLFIIEELTQYNQETFDSL
jgi:hypothetical protein